MARILAIALLAACANHHHHPLDGGDDSFVVDACQGLACFQYDCASKGLPPTSVSGIVYAPNRTLPLYGVTVYVPASDPGPLPDGVSCDQCAAGPLGGALAQTQTDEAGHFELDNVPATSDVPVVIQIGKWRRQLKMPNVAACQNLPLVTADTSLPKSRTDFTPNTTGVDLPRIAISTGDADAIECLPLKLGISPTEISSSAGNGRIHLFTDPVAGQGASQFYTGWAGGTAAMTDSRTLWSDTTHLAPYDILMLSCEGDQYPASKPQSSLQAVHDYAGIGGRIFASHWHNIWIGGDYTNLMHGMLDWEGVAKFNFGGNPSPDTLTATIDEASNPKGMSFATWMLNVGGSTTRDLLTVTQARTTCTSVDTTMAERWVYLDPATSPGFSSAMNFQFTTPLANPPDQRCGKVVFSDMHVSADSRSAPSLPYPSGCACGGASDPLCTTPQALTAQEKALAFMFFDIASCVPAIQ